MKTELIKVQDLRIVGNYKYYLLHYNEDNSKERFVTKISEKQAKEFLTIKNKEYEKKAICN